VLRYRKYRDAFRRNRERLEESLRSMADTYELSLFLTLPLLK